MFDHSLKHALPAAKTLQVVQTLLRNARESKDGAIQMVFCEYADTLLGPMKKTIKPTPDNNSSTTDSEGQAIRVAIAQAYLDHANIVADLGYTDLAQKSRKRADKWGGPLAPLVKKNRRVLQPAIVDDGIFVEDVLPPSLPWTFPEADGRVADTPQLVSCLSLLQHSEESLDETLGSEALQWLKRTRESADERTRLETLVTDLIRIFTRDEIKDNMAVTEVLCLIPVLGEDDFRFLLRLFLNNVNESPILDLGALRGLAQLLKDASPGHLKAQDLIEILGPVSSRLQETHSQSADQIFELTVAVCAILDAMADTKVSGLKRVEMHEPLLAFLGGLQGSSDPHLKYYASYAFQALLCIPDDESPWQATVRRTTKVVKGISGLVSAVKGLDLNGFLSGLQDIQEGFDGIQQVFELALGAYEGVSAIYEGEQDLMVSLKEGLTFDRKRAWYSALRGVDTLIEGGELAKFRVLVCEAPCRMDIAFQWGVCQRLGNLANDPLWSPVTRREAIQFLSEIYRGDSDWGRSPQVKGYILRLLKQLSMASESQHDAGILLEALSTDGDAAKQDIYRSCASKGSNSHLLRPSLPEIASPSLLDRAQKKTDVEADLRRLARLRIKERGGAIYVPPMAKANIFAPNEKFFPLIPKVDRFLAGADKVLLLMGDSGAGKTTFNRELDLKLWKEYKPKTGRIPLLISLPAIDRPDKDLIAKHLRLCEFSESQIRELKDREFILICDGYDESQQTQNLYESNGLNRDGGWKAQMVISCRSDRLGLDYRDLFQPARSSPADPDFFQQAALVPFSTPQVKEYIAQYVSIKRPLWEASDYEGILGQIPSLQELVKNPFLLTLSLEVLPRLTDPGQKVAANKITRVQLYDEFVAQWLEQNKKRIGAQDLSDKEKEAFESLSDDGFTQQGLVFLRDLSEAIFREQDGIPLVEYSRARDLQTWKEQFFGRKDNEIRLLRMALPMTRNGGRYGFIHRSILEYGVSRAIYEPQKQSGLKLQSVERDADKRQRRQSTSSTFSFEWDAMAFEGDKGMDQEREAEAIEQPLLNSLLAKKDFAGESSVLQFLAERVQQESLFKEQLLAILQRSKIDKNVRRAAANAITILVRAGVQFNGADLQGIQIPGADLSNGVFDGTLLQNADLRKVKLRNCWLRGANLSGARMAGVKFGAWPYLQEEYAVRACSYSPHGNTCAIAVGNVIQIYDTSNWTSIIALHGHTDVVSWVVYSPNGLQIASCSDDKTVRLWDANSGDIVLAFEGHSDAVNGVAFSPNGTQISSGGDDNTVRLWDLQEKVVGHILEGHSDGVNAVAYSPDGLLVASGSSDNTIRLWNSIDGSVQRILEGHTGRVMTVGFSPNGEQIASGSSDNTMRLWGAKSGKPGHVLQEHSSYVSSVTFSPNGEQIASGSWDNTICIWDSHSGAIGQTFQGHGREIYCVVFAPGGAQIVSGSGDKTLRLWSVQEVEASVSILQGHTDTISGVACSSSDGQIVSGGDDKTVRVWDVQSVGSPGRVFKGHASSIMSVAFSPNYFQVASGGYDNTIRLWDIKTGAPGHILQGHTGWIKSVAYSPDGSQLASASSDKTVRLWDVGSGAPGRVLQGHTNFIWSVAFSPCGSRLASGSWDNTVGLWDVRSGKLERVFEGHSEAIYCVAYSPSGTQIASGGRDKTIRLWNTETGVLEQTLEGSMDAVNSLAYSQNGLQIASGGDDQRLCIWDSVSGQCLVAVAGFDESILSVDWRTVLGKSYLVTGGIDKLVRQWLVVDTEDGVDLRLCWISPHGELKTKDCILDSVQDLGRINIALMKQGGAVGEPVEALTFQQASRHLVAVSGAASKFKQLLKMK
ncbi:hypothetical protein EMPS_09729 [Entomortierella parvispora]|uniref:NACHT domain-containing protein n=1 Tax=Entomortierella parvispora TaxID=205924 RepID=A0A9P3HIK8_9FUNG|nr:hypothetical protein EMPS_09729 [Entomortierella parvispora]